MAVPPSARPRRSRPTLSAQFSAAAGELRGCRWQGEKLVLVVGPLHQGDGDAPAGAGGDGTVDVAAAESVGEALDLQAELGGIDAVGAVHRQHQRQVDLFCRRGIRRPGCRTKREAEAQTEDGPPQSGFNKAQQLHGLELTMPGARRRAHLTQAANAAEIHRMNTVMTQQVSFSRPLRHPELIDPFGRHVTYLRISVTDRCDFRCVYCMAENMTFLPKKEILTLEEIDRLVHRLHPARGAEAQAHRRRAAGAARTSWGWSSRCRGI